MSLARFVMHAPGARQGLGAIWTGLTRRLCCRAITGPLRTTTRFAHCSAACQCHTRRARAAHHDDACDHQPISQVRLATSCCSNHIETSRNTTRAHDEFECAPCADRLMRKFSMLKFFSCPSSQFSNWEYAVHRLSAARFADKLSSCWQVVQVSPREGGMRKGQRRGLIASRREPALTILTHFSSRTC